MTRLDLITLEHCAYSVLVKPEVYEPKFVDQDSITVRTHRTPVVSQVLKHEDSN